MPRKSVAEERKYRRFVECGEAPDTIAKSVGDLLGIIRKPGDNIAIQPSALVLQNLWQIPVIEAEPGLYAGGEHPSISRS